MRKQITILILAILFIFTTEVTTVYGAELQGKEAERNMEQIKEPDTELIFDPDAVINKTAAKSALADMHGVFVFRSAFITQEALVKEREKKNRENIENIVLTSQQPELDYKEWVDLVLLADTEKYIKDVYIEEEENTLFIWIYCIILSICVLCIAIRIDAMIKKRKKGGRKKRKL